MSGGQTGSFLETAYLLIWGDLPSFDQLRAFRRTDSRCTVG